MSKRSSNSPTPLALELRPSRWLAAAQIGAALLALAALLRGGLPLSLKLFAVVLLPLVVLMSLRLQGLLGGRAPCRALRRESGRWLWIGADGRSVAVRLLRAVVWRHLVVMHFEAPGGRRSLCLLPDSLDADAMRRLRLSLRHLPVYEGSDPELPPR